MWPPRSSTGTEENAADPANSVALPTRATALWEEKADGLAPWERKVKRAPREEEDDGTDGKVSPASVRVTQWFRLWTTLRRRVGAESMLLRTTSMWPSLKRSPKAAPRAQTTEEIGRASCRERVEISGVGGSLRKIKTE